MAPVEPWERVWIDAGQYAEDIHSYINCTDCHGGQAVDDMDAAHAGMYSEVVQGARDICGECHINISPYAVESLHSTLAGYDTVLHERSDPGFYQTLEYMQANHCDSCHASCGDCHISQPSSVGGGLLEGHVFVETPSMSRNCTACHGSRIKDEYYGAHEGIASDVHFRARMPCTDCHTGDEMHGVGVEAGHRYDGAPQPTCESCHLDQIGADSEIREHRIHEPDSLACQVCHSTDYSNCVNCHVEQSDEGVPFFRVESHFLGFYIGRNPSPTPERPYEYIPVRHVPIDPASFSYYGAGLLPDYDARPTWVYTTPHNIQRITPQAEHCRSCHGNDDVFLTSDKVVLMERDANEAVIVRELPRMFGSYEFDE